MYAIIISRVARALGVGMEHPGDAIGGDGRNYLHHAERYSSHGKRESS